MGVALVVGFVSCWVLFFLPGKFDFNLMLFPVVDRPCLALVRQCRKKKVVKIGVCSFVDVLVELLRSGCDLNSLNIRVHSSSGGTFPTFGGPKTHNIL